MEPELLERQTLQSFFARAPYIARYLMSLEAGSAKFARLTD